MHTFSVAPRLSINHEVLTQNTFDDSPVPTIDDRRHVWTQSRPRQPLLLNLRFTSRPRSNRRAMCAIFPSLLLRSSCAGLLEWPMPGLS